MVIDGAFFLRRFRHTFPDLQSTSAEDVCLGVSALANYHISVRLGPKPTLELIEREGFGPVESVELYRIFYYDCAPLTKRLHLPVSGRSYDLRKRNKLFSGQTSISG